PLVTRAPLIAYGVFVTLPAGLIGEWLTWMRTRHIADVLAAGALSAEVVELDGSEFEARYRFASREAFAAYERDHAPRLRAEGLALFPPEKGVQYRRSLGEVRLP